MRHLVPWVVACGRRLICQRLLTVLCCVLLRNRFSEALNTFYGFRHMSPAEKEAFYRGLRAKTPAQMAAREEETRARFGQPADQTGHPSASRRPRRLSAQERSERLTARQSEVSNHGFEVRHPSVVNLPLRLVLFSQATSLPPFAPQPPPRAATCGFSEPTCDDDAMDWEETPSPCSRTSTSGYAGSDTLMYCNTLNFVSSAF